MVIAASMEDGCRKPWLRMNSFHGKEKKGNNEKCS
jgi:hypothetical protein